MMRFTAVWLTNPFPHGVFKQVRKECRKIFSWKLTTKSKYTQATIQIKWVWFYAIKTISYDRYHLSRAVIENNEARRTHVKLSGFRLIDLYEHWASFSKKLFKWNNINAKGIK